MNLVIVESPAKAKTIEKYLGSDFKVLASFGHVRDLPQKELGVDVKNDFLPEYINIDKAKKVLSDIRTLEKKAKILYLATDLDREGEAISWHLLEALKIKENDPKVKRIVFSEITKTALDRAIKNPRGIDMNLVDAQQARRVLDRLVGYKLSPLLWKKVKSGLSAGRVQSVAVRLIVEREDEIKNFKPEEFWLIGVNLSQVDQEPVFKAFLTEIDGKEIKKFDINNEKAAKAAVSGLEKANYKVLSVDKKEQNRSSSAPFTTSTLQMEASRKLGYSAKQTMRLAQGLYEAGHITYMRTDSTNLSDEAVKAIRGLISKEYGQKYLPEVATKYQTKAKRAQEAHEAIRPSHIDKKEVSSDAREQKLYELIWKRTVASQMSDAIFKIITATIEAKGDKKWQFVATGESVKFDGFIKVYTEGKDDDETEELLPGQIPELAVGEKLDYKDLIKEQKFTEPPKRYSEATLVKKLESLGIGRPSTYAPTISTIQDRGYVTLEEKRFFPTEIAGIVNGLLVEHFPDIVDYQFTAHMEDDFDEIASGDKEWVAVIKEFYDPFAEELKTKNKELEKTEFIKPEKTNEKCPECGKPIVIKLGRFGKFMACSNYPECKFSKPLVDKEIKKEVAAEIKEKCEKCGGAMVLKEGRFGKFLACENYPKCKNTKSITVSSGVKCPDCEKGELVEKKTKKGRTFWGCSTYPKCKYASWNDPSKKEQITKDTDNTDEESGEEENVEETENK